MEIIETVLNRPHHELVNETTHRLREQTLRIKFINESEFNDPTIEQEIRRSLVVFLFAQLEETIRSFAILSLDHWDRNKFRDVPLASDDLKTDDKRSKDQKFTLADLADHRGRTVEQVIYQSAYQYLNTVSFSAVDKMVSMLESFGLKKPEEDVLSKLGAMMERRHRIVHHGDFDPKDRSLSREPISKQQINEWFDATVKFIVCCQVAEIESRYDHEKTMAYLARLEAEKSGRV